MYSKKHIIRISTPIFLSLLTQNLVQVVDTAFLGRVGEVELGASALAGIIYIAIFTIGFGFSMGSQILIGRRNGEENYNQIGNIVVQGALFLLLPALLFILAFKLGASDGLRFLFKSDNVRVAIAEYLDWRVYGLIFAFTNAMFRAFFVGIARTKVLIHNSLVMLIVNLVLDYGLIFGNFGLPEMGIGGAALASVIAEFSSTLFFVIYTIKTVDLEKYGFKNVHFQWTVIKRILSISTYMMVQYLLSIVIWMMFFVFIENYLGERSLAVSNIVRSLYNILTIPSHALGSAVNTMVSNTIGAGRKEEVPNLIKRVALMSILCMFAIIAVIVLLPKFMVRIYTNDLQLIADTVPALYIMLSFMPIYGLGSVVFSAVSGTGNTQKALLFEIISLSVYLFYIWFIVAHLRLSVVWAWTSEHVYWSQLFIFSIIYLRYGKWREKEI